MEDVFPHYEHILMWIPWVNFKLLLKYFDDAEQILKEQDWKKHQHRYHVAVVFEICSWIIILSTCREQQAKTA